MSNEFRTTQPTGLTLYAVVGNQSAQAWNTSGTPAFETPAAAHWTAYAIALIEAGTTGKYKGNFPAGIVAVGEYDYTVYQQVGGSPAPADYIVGQGEVDWDGAAEITAASINAKLGTPSVSISADIAAIAGATSGGGPWTLTIIVNDGTTALEGVRVRLVSNIDQPDGATKNVSGPGTAQVVLNPGTRTYSTAIRLAGYNLTRSSGVATGAVTVDSDGNLAVTGNGAVTFSMVRTTPASPSSDGQTVATVLMLDEHGAPDPDGELESQIVSADGTPNLSYPRNRFTDQAESGGYVSIEAAKNVYLRTRRNYGTLKGAWSDPYPTGSLDAFDVPEILGVSNATDR